MSGRLARSMSTNFLSRISRTSRNSACTRMLPPIKTGMITRLMMNALVRTAALYSRLAMTQILRTDGLLQGGGGLDGRFVVGRGDADEDVVQRRPRQLEVNHAATLEKR